MQFIPENKREQNAKKSEKKTQRSDGSSRAQSRMGATIHIFIKFPAMLRTFSTALSRVPIQQYRNGGGGGNANKEATKSKRGKYEICHIHQRYVMCLIKFLRCFGCVAVKLGFMCSVSEMCDAISWNILQFLRQRNGSISFVFFFVRSFVNSLAYAVEMEDIVSVPFCVFFPLFASFRCPPLGFQMMYSR